jgi:hypothetical protein
VRPGARERGALRELLARYLPRRAGVSHGFVIDASGAQSEQLDVIVYDQTMATVIEVAKDVHYYPCETVIAVGQVKTQIRSTRELNSALDNVASAKVLDRSNNDTNEPITGPGYSIPLPFDPSTIHRDQILGFVFTASSLAESSLIKHIGAWLARHPRRVWPNLYCDYNAALVSYEDPHHLTTSAMDATNLYVTAAEEIPNLLLLFISLLSDFVNIAHVARPRLLDYAGIGTTIHRDYPLPKRPNGQSL